PISASRFYVTSTNLSDTFFTGTLGSERSSAYSTTKTREADFSSLQRKGSFVLLVPGLGHSYVFRIGEDVHRETAVTSIRAFFYQRVSMPLEERYAGKWHRSAGHPDLAVQIHPSAVSAARPAGTVVASPGGWYDAGDYNKYIVNSGITMATLLSAYEDFQAYYDTLRLNLPESGDRVPDLLNEVVYNLRWMLTMQDPADGGVYHKCTNASFDGMVMPGVTKLPRYLVQKGTAASLDFAAVTAQAARILSKFNSSLPGLADSCRRASERAWQWSVQHPEVLYDQNKLNAQFEPKITTGAYGDRQLADEWFWAAAELYTTTKTRSYWDTVLRRRPDSLTLPTWNNTYLLGYYTLTRHQRRLPKETAETVGSMASDIKTFAGQLLDRVPANAFGTVMGQSVRDFNWGSNSNAANQGIALIHAWLLTGDRRYIDGALTNADYILGRNGTGYSFITGIGSKSTQRPHHRPSVADGIAEPVPGFLAGGPNPAKQDKCVYEFSEPETAYTDHDCSYASNEIAINWQAPAAYLFNALEAIR
ncbi:MAG TPA: glycoside hydrolase family 9 protein, partial [Chitinophagaceae bacterium]|nr:glycoside hydrolase family 9 protein [Chitinophagaceae bacterium]